jgi:hypothetical protein
MFSFFFYKVKRVSGQSAMVNPQCWSIRNNGQSAMVNPQQWSIRNNVNQQYLLWRIEHSGQSLV